MPFFSRIALRALHRSGSRVDRFKLARKSFIRQVLLADETIADAVREHSTETSVSQTETWKRVETYIDEIVPFFNILTYYKIGLVTSRLLLNFFYKVSAEYAGRPSRDAVPRDAIVIYLMNHRSNADYVLVGYALSGQVAISYAVG
jgi:glycerol-3-phosphate O-acyltransferase